MMLDVLIPRAVSHSKTVGGATVRAQATAFPAPIIWLASCDRGINQDWEASQLCLLHESERRRYYGFLRPQRRRQFLIGRVLLRHALSDLFAVSPGGWQIRECPGRAPRLASATPVPVTFSLAHSQDRVVCILAKGAMVGVDIEYMGRQRDFLHMAAYFFHPKNVRQLQALHGAEQAGGFYRLWTLHEAAVKLSGGWDSVRNGWYGYGGDFGPAFATTVVEEYSIAVAVCGGGLLSGAIKQFDPEAGIEVHRDVIWNLYRAERVVQGGATPALFARCS